MSLPTQPLSPFWIMEKEGIFRYIDAFNDLISKIQNRTPTDPWYHVAVTYAGNSWSVWVMGKITIIL